MKLIMEKSVAKKNRDFLCCLCQRKVNQILQIELVNDKITIRFNFLYLCERCSEKLVNDIKEMWA
ncbi:MAG TPA: hypothetical protein ENI51_07875 [Candidatus Atribacteria bacterium]|nr:hypothetical protein [Candidatus Atribacteria bacterium]